MRWVVLFKRQVLLKDLVGQEIETLVYRADWQKVIELPRLLYQMLV